MPKDVRLPNGTLILNVPDDMKKHQIAGRAIKEGLATNKDFGYEEVEQDKATFLEGMGAGFMDIGRSVGNMVGLVDDETVMDQRKIDEGLGGWGKAGKITGELLATAPLGMGTGAAVGRGAAAMGARRVLPKALASSLGRGVGRGAVEGATYGAIMADPNERGAGAVGGAAFGGALSGAGRALGKTLGKTQFVGTIPEAKRLSRLMKSSGEDEFIPLAQAAKPGMMKNIYEAFLANMPGVSGKVRGQYQTSLDNFRRMAGEEAMPDSSHAHSIVNFTGSETVEQMMGKLNRYWKTAFDPIKKYKIKSDFNGPAPSLNPTVERVIGTQIKEGTLRIPAAGKVLSGDDVVKLRNTLNQLMPDDKASQGAIKSYIKQLDDMVGRNLNPTGKAKTKSATDLRNYIEASEAYPNWMSLNKAVKGAQDKIHFDAKGLAGAAFKTPIRADKTRLQRAGELGTSALRDFPSREGIYQTLAAVGTATSATGAVLGSTSLALLAPAVIAIGRLGASKGLQKYLMRQTKWQKLSKSLMNKYTKELQALGFTGRQAAQMLGVENAS